MLSDPHSGLAGRTELTRQRPPGLQLAWATKLGEKLLAHASQCTDPDVSAYLQAGGTALAEIGLQRDAVLHTRPATDEAGRTRLYRWRLLDAYFIDDGWLDQFARRIDDLQVELNALRPPLAP